MLDVSCNDNLSAYILFIIKTPNNYFRYHVCLSALPSVCQFNIKISNYCNCITINRYVLRVKNMHSGLPSDPWGLSGEAKLSYVYDNIRQSKAKLSYLWLSKLILVFYHLPNVGPKQLCALIHLGCTHEAGTS